MPEPVSMMLVPDPEPVIWEHQGGWKVGKVLTYFPNPYAGPFEMTLIIEAPGGIYEVDSALVKKLDTSYRKKEKENERS
jgi:hypothetical protein